MNLEFELAVRFLRRRTGVLLRGTALAAFAGVALAAFGIDAVCRLHAQLVDTPGGGPALEVTAAIAAAVAAGAWLRWRELGAGPGASGVDSPER